MGTACEEKRNSRVHDSTRRLIRETTGQKRGNWESSRYETSKRREDSKCQ